MKADKFLIRLPEGMRDTLKIRAAAVGRSMNSEIASLLAIALGQVVDGGKTIPLSEDVPVRVAVLETKVARLMADIKELKEPLS